MFWAALTGYIAVLLVGVAGVAVTVASIPGLWVMWLCVLLYAWATGWAFVGWQGLLALAVLALLAEVAEFVVGAAGGKVAGGGWKSVVGAVVGGLVGAIALSLLIPVLGSVIGAIAGAGIGAMLLEGIDERDFHKLSDIGVGAAKGRAWSIVIKFAFGVAMLVVFAVVGWPS